MTKTRENEVGNRIKQFRKELGIKQKDFAEQINMSGPSLSEIETGKYKPGYDFLVNIAKVFNANLHYVLFGQGDMFIDPLQTYSISKGNFGSNKEDVRKFLWYFERSSIMHYYILSAFKNKLLKDKESIDKEIETYKRKKG